MTLSLCMIVKNEEETLERCLSSVKGVFDEIIIVDTGSLDKTKEIAFKFTDKVFDFEWADDFSKARNFSFSKATSDYIMWLDADDVLLERDREELIKLKQGFNGGVDMYFLKYRMGEKGESVYYRERIFKRINNPKWVSPVHEVIVPCGKCVYTDIEVTHKKVRTEVSKRNLNIFKKMIKEGKELDPRQSFYYARELFYHKYYKQAAKEFEKFLESDGWVENKIEAVKNLSVCYRILKREEKALKTLFTSFYYDLPRAEICVDIAGIFFEKKNYDAAIYWYREALIKTPDIKKGGFCNMDCYGYIPSIQLCVCYYNIGDIKTAKKYNDLALKFKPDDKSALENILFFKKALSGK